MKKNTRVLTIMILILLGALTVGYKIWFSPPGVEKQTDKEKSQVYLQGVKSIDYTPTFTGFILEKFTDTNLGTVNKLNLQNQAL